MKRIVIIAMAGLLLLGKATTITAQMSESQTLPIAVCVPTKGTYASVHDILANKLNAAVTQSGITGDNSNPRFVMYPVISLLEKQRTATPPVMTIVQLQVNVYIADYVDKKEFASTSFVVKGGGQSEEKAYMDAIKKINGNGELQRLLSEGKQRIIDYYNTMCYQLIQEANALAVQNKYEEAMSILANVPQQSDCFLEARFNLMSIYQKFSEYDCGRTVQQARKAFVGRELWEALMLVSDINPKDSCYEEARSLFQEISAYVAKNEEQARQDTLDARNRKYELEALKQGMEYTTYLNDQLIQQRKEDRAYEIARILAMNTISISDGSVMQDYVNSLINPYW